MTNSPFGLHIYRFLTCLREILPSNAEEVFSTRNIFLFAIHYLWICKVCVIVQLRRTEMQKLKGIDFFNLKVLCRIMPLGNWETGAEYFNLKSRRSMELRSAQNHLWEGNWFFYYYYSIRLTKQNCIPRIARKSVGMPRDFRPQLLKITRHSMLRLYKRRPINDQSKATTHSKQSQQIMKGCQKLEVKRTSQCIDHA